MEIQLDNTTLQLLVQYSIDHNVPINSIINKSISRELSNYYAPKTIKKEIKQDADYFINGYCESHTVTPNEMTKTKLLLEVGLAYLTVENMLMHKVNDDTNGPQELMERIRLRFNGMSQEGLKQFVHNLINDYYNCGSLIENDETGYRDDYDQMCQFYNEKMEKLVNMLDATELADQINQLNNLSDLLFEIYHND